MRRSTPLPSLARLRLGEDTGVTLRGDFTRGEVDPTDRETWDRLLEEDCPICLQPLTQPSAPTQEGREIRDPPWALNCRHVFHLSCLTRWMRGRGPGATCPECRVPIDPRPEVAPAAPPSPEAFDVDGSDDEEGEQNPVIGNDELQEFVGNAVRLQTTRRRVMRNVSQA